MPDVRSKDAAAPPMTALVDALAAATRVCLITIDGAGRVTGWSRTASQLFGYSAGDILGGSWHRLAPGQESNLDHFVAQISAGRPVAELTVSCRTSSGTAVPAVLAAAPIPDGNSPAGTIVAIRTQRPPSQDAARRLAAIVDSSDDAIMSTDLNGILESWNRAAAIMFGYPAEEMIGQSIRRIIPQERQYEADDALARIRGGEQVDHFETVRRRKDGTLLPISLTVSPIRDDDGRVIGASKIARDIRDRKRLAAIVESSDDAIVSKTLEGIVTSWNAAAQRMFGYTAADMIGQSIRRIIPADRQNEEDEVLARIARGEKVEHFETVRQRKNGTLIHISLTVSPIRDERGAVVGASKIARDVTERIHAEAERARLLALAERNASVTETLNRVGGIVASTLDRDAVVQAVTDAATELTSAQFGAFFYNVVNAAGETYTLFTISGVPREAFARFPMPRNTAVFEPTFRGTSVVRSDDITSDPRYGRNPPFYGQPKGHLPVRSYLAVPVRSPSGDVIGGLFFGHPEPGRFSEDHERLAVGMSGWASVALENARLYQSAQQANRLKDEFLATFSHELRTPLNAILGYARMLRSGMLVEDRQPRAIATIERNAESLTQIVEDVLDVSRIVSGKMRLNVQAVTLAEVVQRAIEAVQPTADVKGVRLQAVLDATAGPVAGDPERIQQIAWNLLSNAVKFTDSGGRVDVEVHAAHPHVALTVRDTGAGISPEFLPHMFERFRQADGGITRLHGGLGLGLSIVRQLVEMHGGTVTGESPGIGEGATFTVRLPMMVAAADRPNVPSTSAASQQYLASGLPDLTGVTVLAVDDDADALAMVRDILEAAGATVNTAQTAEGALTALEQSPVDVLVADLGMPRVDGFEMMRRLRGHTNARIRSVPAAALTAYARSEERTKALATGFQMHLSKPISPADLVQTVRALSRSRA